MSFVVNSPLNVTTRGTLDLAMFTLWRVRKGETHPLLL